MASEGTSYDYDDKCEKCWDGYHAAPHVYPDGPERNLVAEADELVRRTKELEERCEELEGTIGQLATAKFVYVQPSDVVIISGLDWDARGVTDDELAAMKLLFGVKEVMLLSGPAEFTVIREGEK